VSDLVKPTFVIFDIRALWRSVIPVWQQWALKGVYNFQRSHTRGIQLSV